MRVGIDKAMERFNSLRGLMALWIVVGHCSIEFETEIFPLLLVHRFNLVVVGMFFFLSGYGLAYSYDNKKDYLRGFLKKKAAFIFSITFVVYLFTVMLFDICNIERVDSARSFVIGYFTKTNWYMFELMVFYVIFWLVFRLEISSWRRLMLCFLGAGFILVIVPFSSLTQSYYISSMAFPFGIMVYMYKDKLDSIIGKYPIGVLLASALVCGLACLSILFPNKSFVAIMGKNLMCIACCCTMLTILSFKGCRQSVHGIYDRLSKISLEIYLWQFPILSVVKNYFIENDMEIDCVYIVICCVLIIMVSGIVHTIRDGIVKYLFHPL